MRIDIPEPIRVQEPGRYFSGPPEKVVECWLEHPRFPDFRFRVDWALESGDLVGFGIHCRHEDRPPPGGITKRDVYLKVPLEALLKAARRAWAKHARELPESLAFYEVDDRGRTIATGTVPSSSALGRRVRTSGKRAASRRGMNHGTRPRYTERELAQLMDRFVQWVHAGGSVAAFRESEDLKEDTFDYQRKRAEQLGLFKRGGKRGDPRGASLTDEGQRVLNERSE